MVAEQVLTNSSLPSLIAALEGELDVHQLDGAARFCVSSEFRRNRKKLPRGCR